MIRIIDAGTIYFEKYRLEVEQYTDSYGILKVKAKEDDELIGSCDVSISYGAMFGVDIYDQEVWFEKAEAIVEKFLETKTIKR